MFKNKYSKVLTIVLIIAIVVIVGLLCFWLYDNLKGDKLKKDAEAGIEEFNKNNGIEVEETPKIEETPTPDVGDQEIPDIIETSPTPPINNNGGNGSGGSNNTYKGFTMIGYIEIPKTDVKIPILNKSTKKSLEVAVGTLFPADAKLNEPYNVVIAGHNYRNKLFFSNNKNLKEGDKIYITDESGRKLTYIVYSNFQATAEDTSFYTRDTGGKPEITLTTCVANDSSKRTIILARAE